MTFRRRNPPIDRRAVYGDFAAEMIPGTKLHGDIADRAAFMLITGIFPSHLRTKSVNILRQITSFFRRPTSIDGRSGRFRVNEAAARDLGLNNRPIVKVVRQKVSEGYKIQPSRGLGTRRSFGKIYMFKATTGNVITEKITITIEGAIKKGWD